jgi:ABC-2 family transporter protein
MIRLSLLQLRTQVIAAAAAVTAFAILLAVTGPHLASMYAASGLPGCQPTSCGQLASRFLHQADSTGPYATVSPLSLILISITPAVLGLFWGAPLIARELETGTFALAWTQSVTRTRWLAVKLAVGGIAAIALTEGLSLMFAWWAAPLRRAAGHGATSGTLAMNQFEPLAFATHGITPLGYAAFAFALGVTIGALVRRSIAAMALTLTIFIAVQIAMPLWIRPNLFPTSHTTIPVTGDTVSSVLQIDSPPRFTYTLAANGLPGQPQAWIQSSGATDTKGHPVSTAVPSACSPLAASSASLEDVAKCLTNQGIRLGVTYQPASRYWPLQGAETGIFLVLSLALIGYSFRRISRLP